MSNRTKLGLNILEAALLLGVLGDALLRETPWGLNVLLWAGALVLSMWALHGRCTGRASWREDGGWLLVPVAFFAAAFAWRDSATLKVLDGLALFVAFALLAWRTRGRTVRLAGLGDYALGLGHAAFDALFASLPLVMSDVQWGTIPRGGTMRHVWAVARGLVIAVPLLLIFGALLMAADAVFEGIMRQTFQLDAGVLFSHLFLTLLFAWMAGGFLRGMMLTGDTASEILHVTPSAYTSITIDDKERNEPGKATTHERVEGAHRQPPESVVIEGGATAEDNSSTSGNAGARPDGIDDARGQTSAPALVQATTTYVTTGGAATNGAAQATSPATSQGFALGAVEVGVVLGLLNVLFACFVAVQFRYFFGGAARVMSITELTYSEYARRGFFELTWVAGLVLPLLLITHALLRRDRPDVERIFRLLAGTQVALLFVIMASAVVRMRLYQSEYGLTELRLYTTAFMVWLGLVFIWFTWTVLVRSRRERFACGALIAAFVTIGLLHLLNPDAFIVRANTAHAVRAGRAFDAEYAATLSADAVPALISALPALNHDERCLVARRFSQDWTPTMFDEDWRAWNFSRWRARRAVSSHREAFNQTDCPPPPGSMPLMTTTMPTTSAPEPPPPVVPPSRTMTPASSSSSSAPTDAATATAASNVTTLSMKTELQGAAANAPKSAKPARTGRRRATRLKELRAGQRKHAR